jgi:protein-L-isoaspartate(D-aspartate) O-methyltransferase
MTEAEKMVERQILRRGITNPGVLDAMRRVPREEFVPASRRASAYQDCPLPIGKGQTISQPYIVAYMTEQLAIRPRDKVLEVGSGCGYQTAVLLEMGAEVHSVEIIESLRLEAEERLRRLGYGGARLYGGDGSRGLSGEAPFDAIIVAAAATAVPDELVRQLAPEGRMVLPVGGAFDIQELVLVTKDPAGRPVTRSLIPVRFVPLVEPTR